MTPHSVLVLRGWSNNKVIRQRLARQMIKPPRNGDRGSISSLVQTAMLTTILPPVACIVSIQTGLQAYRTPLGGVRVSGNDVWNPRDLRHRRSATSTRTRAHKQESISSTEFEGEDQLWKKLHCRLPWGEEFIPQVPPTSSFFSELVHNSHFH